MRRTEATSTSAAPDSFAVQADSGADVSSEYAEQIDAAFEENLGRAPTADEVRKYTELAGLVPPEQVNDAFKWVICSSPEWQARTVFREELGREPTADELQRAVAWGNDLVAQGKSTGELRAAFLYTTRMGPEWQARTVYQQTLGRDPTPEELKAAAEWGEDLVADGKTTGEVRAAFLYTLKQTPEYQALRTPDRIREEVAQWAVAQADDPNVGYGQYGSRFGTVTDAAGHRYFDCSGLVYAAYQQAGIELGGNWTGAMWSNHESWSDEVPKDPAQMMPGDLILMDGHVIMYAGNGQCVGAQSGKPEFDRQVRADIDVWSYLNRGDSIVLRPRV
ncbi:MAG: C40 family peptidase [Archangiaceae bacterium]|nr:C40 family peptidase [Archangiaceae bacterium]